ncbi:MAG: hypothetical protein A3F31_02820 [Candidatus Levybacteria bacterium RIFCSPHIGHO2_12_FULL_38_12]|nr:MAG: hypothetical protein A2770_00930 [Candidatus Levybacteria bacterium RIFCSPHIGHO2_01_FULL_38_12]OGH22491.1 MAG: hypothetical protein A3F31_02820 [Candidatus Levybacteria bacterium RIFCSPHIGHO2_12_FULL_38_12]OGH33764.1 MAG: hypothetical protein A3A47_01185 [Candidatus Levybacteria bacterium RIFCSPLOWO2_01_FULL_37_20]OGH43464.1 MAG: hypothetical protein A3J14_01395 [Candidatus Levybacteria bacterium RIFCSPLOWO2_02_FULL_37_18]
MVTSLEANRFPVKTVINPDAQEETQSSLMIRDYYKSLHARAVVFMDKDDTTIHMEVGEPTDPRLEEVIKEAQKKGVVASYDSDSSYVDLEGWLGMRGLSIAERGGLVRFPDGREVHLVRSGDWFKELIARFAERLIEEKELKDTTAVLHLDPWPFLFADTHIPGQHNQLVMVNTGRKVSASFVTGLLDQVQGGKIVRHTPESARFHQEMAAILLEERDRLASERPFPDPEGMVDDVNHESELVIVKSAGASKQRAMGYLSWVLKPLGIPVYHIGDNPVSDNMTEIPGVVTMAVGNGGLKDCPGVIAASQPMASGVVELFENHIIQDLK